MREEGLRVGDSSLRRSLPQRREVRVAERSHGLHEPRVDLGLGQRALRRREEPRTKLELVVGKVEVEELHSQRTQAVGKSSLMPSSVDALRTFRNRNAMRS